MYQDILPHRFDNQYHPAEPDSADIVFSFTDEGIIMKDENSFFTVREIGKENVFTYLFRIDDTCFYLGDCNNIQHVIVPPVTMRTFEPKHLAFACITARQVYLWMNRNSYCGKCGQIMKPHDTERAMVCPSCGNIVYPNLMPAVIVGVLNEKNEILLTRYANRGYKKLALVAGFAEIGETIEETVVREVKEETGLDVTDVTYYCSQPWAFSSTILFGFWCKADSSQKIRMDDGELSLAQWHDRNVNIDDLDHASLTAHMIRAYKKGL